MAKLFNYCLYTTIVDCIEVLSHFVDHSTPQFMRIHQKREGPADRPSHFSLSNAVSLSLLAMQMHTRNPRHYGEVTHEILRGMAKLQVLH